MDTVELFRQKGYEIDLTYFLLPGVSASANRVKTRVTQGGHDVSIDSIKFNYEEGIKNLLYFCDRFDHLSVLDASGQLGELKPFVSFAAKSLVYYDQDIPKWARKTIDSLIAQLNIPSTLQLRPREDDDDPKRGRKR